MMVHQPSQRCVLPMMSYERRDYGLRFGDLAGNIMEDEDLLCITRNEASLFTFVCIVNTHSKLESGGQRVLGLTILLLD